MSRAVVIRSGGLGDFLLTLPLLTRLRADGRAVHLVTRRAWHQLIAGDGLTDGFTDIDSARFASLWSNAIPDLATVFADAEVFCLLPDPDGTLQRAVRRLGATAFRRIDARPTAPPHAALRILLDSGLSAKPDVLTTSHLHRPGQPEGTTTGRPAVLWIHPGSGAAAKNADPEWFAASAKQFLAQGGTSVTISFGAADEAVAPLLTKCFAAAGVPFEVVQPPAVTALRTALASRATAFLGNDTGVTHLAAALAIPTEAVFLATDPDIWGPVGETVTITDLRPDDIWKEQ